MYYFSVFNEYIFFKVTNHNAEYDIGGAIIREWPTALDLANDYDLNDIYENQPSGIYSDSDNIRVPSIIFNNMNDFSVDTSSTDKLGYGYKTGDIVKYQNKNIYTIKANFSINSTDCRS